MHPVNQHLLAKLRMQDKSLVDDSGRVAVEAPCRGCGYNLRGASTDGGCPECRHAVADSLRDDRPEYSDPKWLGRVVLGGNLCIATVIAPVALLLLLAILGWAGEAIGMRGHEQWLLYYGVLPIVAGCHLLASLSAWLITLRDPARHHHRTEARYRWSARLGISLSLPTALILAWLHQHAIPLQATQTLWDVSGTLATAIPVVLFLMGSIGFLLYLRTLTTRMAEWQIVRYLKTVCFGTALCSLTFLCAVLLVILAPRQNKFTIILIIALCGSVALGAFFAIWAIMLTDQTRQALNTAHRRMKRTVEDVTHSSMDANL